MLLVNKEIGLPKDYVPNNLIIPNVAFGFEEIVEKRYLQDRAAKALERLFLGAKRDCIYLVAISGYRSYARQAEIYENNVLKKGKELTDLYSAKPGHSEHQTGLAMDISSASMNYELTEAFDRTKEGKWLAKHAQEYGFIIRYPKGKEKITGYQYEPWHIRYIGNPFALCLTRYKLTLEEYC